MDENKKDDVEKLDVENLEVEVLSDSDLESASGGGNNTIFSQARNACCPG
jgi:hypothetical protein